MNKTNTLHNLDNSDAVVFIYEKTLNEIYGPNSASSSNTISNILSISDMGISNGSEIHKCNKVLWIVCRLSTILFWFQHPTLTTKDRLELIETHIPQIAMLFADYSLDVLFPFIETVQEKISPLEKDEYTLFLTSLTKQIKRAIKHQQIPTKCAVDDFCLQINSCYREKTIEQIGVEEGWKKPIEDLVKTILS
jgi:hypothetical protein